jgi:hypothetical protein
MSRSLPALVQEVSTRGPMLQEGYRAWLAGARACSRVNVTVTSRDVTVTSTTCGKICWEAGMFKGISDVRSYVGFGARNPAVPGGEDREK